MYVGIDVAKATLDVHVLPSGEAWSTQNTPVGHAALAERVAQLQPTTVVLEATGGYEAALVAALLVRSLPVVIVNPRQVRAFATAIGQRAKTDRIDAQVLARFAETLKPSPRPLPTAATAELDALVQRRRQLVDMRVAEGNRLDTCRVPRVRESIETTIAWLNARIKELDNDLDDQVRKSPAWREQEELFTSVPGVGTTTARTLLASLPELGTLSRREIAALAGLAPFANESGPRRGKRTIRGGRADVRRSLYMASLTAIRFNAPIRALYQRLVAGGKIKKVALIACARKLLTVLNAIAKSKTAWQPPTEAIA